MLKYIPESSLPLVGKWFEEYDFHLRITKSRRTKFGDFRPAYQNQPNRISVNGDLNPYHFLLTLTHEAAHAATWQQHQNKVSPHGKEWKTQYAKMLLEVLQMVQFPEDLKVAISQHLKRPKASSCNDPELYKILKKYDNGDELLFLEDLPEKATFKVHGKRTFIKGKKRRTRFECIEKSTKRVYLISGHAPVELIE